LKKVIEIKERIKIGIKNKDFLDVITECNINKIDMINKDKYAALALRRNIVHNVRNKNK